ncbi:MAG: tryptophan-rich sensory protein [Actinobacteria bacterium]|nr:tryptophan-rich sensory protein [Actinomycetota bacterium]
MVSDDARNRGSEAPARSVLALVGFVAACFVAALVGSEFTAPSIPEWYESLAKPFFTPPSWLFGPVWTALYLAMAFAGWLVWRGGSTSTTALPLALFGGQLVLNALWSVLFFGLRSPGVALVEILVLWAAILATLLLFRRIGREAGWLLAPYLAWVTFAALLNFEIWQLNA